MQFKTYGTTDRIYTTLVDYANGQGEHETFGIEGFTDSKNELPLLSEQVGVTAQGACDRLFAEATYTHRTGYYGRKSQYSASHERHHGDLLALRLRYDLARKAQRLIWVDLQMTTEQLTAERENYRRTTATNGSSVTYYEYFEPTKMADKVQTYGTAAVTAYWKPAADIYLWHLKPVSISGHAARRPTSSRPPTPPHPTSWRRSSSPAAVCSPATARCGRPRCAAQPSRAATTAWLPMPLCLTRCRCVARS